MPSGGWGQWGQQGQQGQAFRVTLTSRCSLQILHSQMAWGRLLVVCTPHLVHTFCGQNKELGDVGATKMSP